MLLKELKDKLLEALKNLTQEDLYINHLEEYLSEAIGQDIWEFDPIYLSEKLEESNPEQLDQKTHEKEQEAYRFIMRLLWNDHYLMEIRSLSNHFEACQERIVEVEEKYKEAKALVYNTEQEITDYHFKLDRIPNPYYSDEYRTIKRNLEVAKEDLKKHKQQLNNASRNYDSLNSSIKGLERKIEYFNSINHELDLKSFYNYVQSSKPIQEKKWRKTLYSALNEAPKLKGSIIRVRTDGVDHCFFKREKELNADALDYSILLALKNGIRTSPSIKTNDGGHCFALSGGIMAEVKFKAMTAELLKFKKETIEIFRAQHPTKNTLYYQHGYANSTIDIELRDHYILLTEDFWIELKLHATPILFNNSPIPRIPNISGKAKMDDEERERIEEEKRKEEEDFWDYMDDLHDDW